MKRTRPHIELTEKKEIAFGSDHGESLKLDFNSDIKLVTFRLFFFCHPLTPECSKGILLPSNLYGTFCSLWYFL